MEQSGLVDEDGAEAADRGAIRATSRTNATNSESGSTVELSWARRVTTPWSGISVRTCPPARFPSSTKYDRASTNLEHELGMAESAPQWVNSFQCPSETTSTAPSTTLMAVSSSIAYAGTGMSAAHFSALAMVLSSIAG